MCVTVVGQPQWYHEIGLLAFSDVKVVKETGGGVVLVCGCSILIWRDKRVCLAQRP